MAIPLVVMAYREPTREAGNAIYRYEREFQRDETLTSASVGKLTVETNFLLQMAE